MATSYYLLNHTQRQYLDLGKLVGSTIAESQAHFYRMDNNTSLSAGAVVLYMMEARGDELQWVSDVEHELDFFGSYQEVDMQSLLSTFLNSHSMSETPTPALLSALSDADLLALNYPPGSDAHYDQIMEICGRGLHEPEAGKTACTYLPELGSG